jgi:hypothetical protein
MDVLVRWDGREIDLFVDGSKVTTVGWISSGIFIPTEPVRIGAESVNGKANRAFHGELEELGLWSRSLSDREVAALMRTPPSPSVALNRIGPPAARDHSPQVPLNQRSCLSRQATA